MLKPSTVKAFLQFYCYKYQVFKLRFNYLMRCSKKTIDDHILTYYTSFNQSAATQHTKKEALLCLHN
ncbi:hypothetical protein A9Q75_17795 [Colwellia psychrerythraea]|uniref:Uncharacterized protein n=1 Tax=Colwellia psychrerythraea TaxID=28229 RepID=A0A1Y5E3B2_COLPS|nr:hypothetical protein A9Q75_17795 [Colwellia psychrerythraea]